MKKKDPYAGCTSNCGDDPMMPSGCHKEGCALGPAIKAHSKSEYKRLSTMGVNVVPPEKR